MTPEQLAAMKAAAEEGKKHRTPHWQSLGLTGNVFSSNRLVVLQCSFCGGQKCVTWSDYAAGKYDSDARNTDYPAMLATAVAEVERLQAALKQITEIRWGYDGDCGAVAIAESALQPKEPAT